MCQLNRRQFLQALAATLAGFSLPHVSAFAPIERFTRPYLAWLDHPDDAPLNELFAGVVGDHTLGFILYDISNQVLIGALQPETALPIASAFKAPLLMYFVHTIDEAVWNSVPVEYWNANFAREVPAEFQAAWTQHRYILKDLYIMIAISDNPATGRVLAYIAKQAGSKRPIFLFNEWSHQEVGISPLSGLSDWYFGIPNNMDATDFRWGGQGVVIDEQSYRYSNLFSPRDMGLYYTWFLDKLSPQQHLVCGTLLNQIYAGRLSNIEDLARQNGGMAFSKNGTLGRDISSAGIVITDAGIIQHGNGTSYLMVMLAANAERQVPQVVEVVDQVLKGHYDDFIQAAKTGQQE